MSPWGAIAGDLIGSPYEHRRIRTTDFPLFSEESRYTDDTVLTVATADALLSGGDYAELYRSYGRAYPYAGYGGRFFEWIHAPDPEPYGSWGNGAAMRVSPVGWTMDSVDEVLREAERSAVVSHDHPEGIRGAQAVALAVFLARGGVSRERIRSDVEARLGYDLSRSVEEIREGYGFDVSAKGSVPEAISCFLESSDFESAVRLAVSLGGDSDTQASIAGAIADAFYGGVPREIAEEAERRLPGPLREVAWRFADRYGAGGAAMDPSPRLES